MAIYPGAVYRPLHLGYLSGNGNGLPMAAYNRINHHVAAGYGSLFNYFNQPSRASSHFWIAKSGLVEQYVDTALRAEADYQGNDATISNETESKGEAWTEAQIQAIIALDIWLCDTHGIPKVLAENSWIGQTSKGLSWHRLGINGNFPGGRYGGRLQRGGGMLYSTATGKSCPVETNIDLMYDRIYPGVSGGVVPVDNPIPVPVPVPDPTPAPPPKKVAEDGYWGSGTTAELQSMFGTYRDGEIWYQYAGNKQPGLTTGWVWNYSRGTGSPLISAMQNWLNANGFNAGSADGVAGTQFYSALQRRYGVPVDGELWAPSETIRRMQQAINNGAF